MCGRATLTTSPDDLRDAFSIDVMPAMTPRYNIAPTQPIAVVRTPGVLELLRWGLVPSFANEPGEGGVHINARAETVRSNPLFRHAFAKQRCLVLVDGFYEWKPIGKATVGPRGGKHPPKKQPFHLGRKSGEPFALAGLWDRWRSRSGDVIESCTIVTCAARGVVADLHGRMPVVIERAAFDSWMRGTPDEAWELLTPREPELVTYPVSTLVNDAKIDDPRCIDPEAGSIRNLNVGREPSRAPRPPEPLHREHAHESNPREIRVDARALLGRDRRSHPRE